MAGANGRSVEHRCGPNIVLANRVTASAKDGKLKLTIERHIAPDRPLLREREIQS
jgi:hypothetical protein